MGPTATLQRAWVWTPAIAAATAGVLLVVGRVGLSSYWIAVALLAVCVVGPVLLEVVSVGGALALVVASTVVAPAAGGGRYASLACALVACVAWAYQMVVRRRAVVGRTRVVGAAVAFMALAMVSFLAGQYPWYSVAPAPMRAQLGGLAIFLVSGGLLLTVGHQVRSLATLKRLTWLFVGFGAFFVLQQSSGADALSLLNPLTQPDSVGSLFWTWFVAVTISQGLVNPTLTPIVRAGLLCAGGLAIFRGLFLAFDWVSGWLPPLVAMVVVVACRFPRLALCTGALAAAPLLALGGPALDGVLRGESYSVMTRLEAATVVAQVLERNPWIGFGPANYYHYTQLFPIMGWWVRFNSHNNYVDIVAQTGVIGLLAFLWLAVELLALARRLARGLPRGFGRAYAVGALAGLTASLVAGLLADWVIPFTYNIGIEGFRSSLLFWFMSGGLLALSRMVAHHETASGGWEAAERAPFVG